MSPSALSPLHISTTGAGEPEIILVHGFGAYGHFWRKWIPALSAEHRVHNVDLMGFGEAATPSGGDYSPSAQAHHLAQFIRRIQSRTEAPPVLIGHSLGAGIALLAALVLKDQKLEVPLSGIVIVSGAIYEQRLPRYLTLMRNPAIAALLVLIRPPRFMLARGIREIVHDPATVNDEQVEGYYTPLTRLRRRRAMLRAAAQLDPAVGRHLQSRLREIGLPTMLVWGEEDPIVPVELGRRLARDLPNAELRSLPGIGHLPPEEDPDRSLAPVLELLDSLR